MNTKHKVDCGRVFKRYDMTCPRCVELSQGAQARAGWNDLAKSHEAMRIEAIRSHDFAACARKHIVCTCFDY
jgi:hypothetical protein